MNNDIVIKPADKGGSIVIMNTKDYTAEAERQLNNPDHYEKLQEDPIINSTLTSGTSSTKLGDLTLLTTPHITIYKQRTPGYQPSISFQKFIKKTTQADL